MASYAFERVWLCSRYQDVTGLQLNYDAVGFNSKERWNIQAKVDSLIGETTFYEIFEPVSH